MQQTRGRSGVAPRPDPWRRIDAPRRWSDLVAPPAAVASLQSVPALLSERYWTGSATPGEGGRRSVLLLMSGSAGTGKTLAAQVLAHELGLPILHVDLESVFAAGRGVATRLVARLFATAQQTGAVLELDHSDFALSSEVAAQRPLSTRVPDADLRDLMDRCETHPGVVVFPTAHLREVHASVRARCDATIELPFPEQPARAEIWRRSLPAGSAVSEGDVQELASAFQLPGGAIAGCCAGADRLAAADGGAVGLAHLARALEQEYATRLLSDPTRAALARLHERAARAGADPVAPRAPEPVAVDPVAPREPEPVVVDPVAPREPEPVVAPAAAPREPEPVVTPEPAVPVALAAAATPPRPAAPPGPAAPPAAAIDTAPAAERSRAAEAPFADVLAAAVAAPQPAIEPRKSAPEPAVEPQQSAPEPAVKPQPPAPEPAVEPQPPAPEPAVEPQPPAPEPARQPEAAREPSPRPPSPPEPHTGAATPGLPLDDAAAADLVRTLAASSAAASAAAVKPAAAPPRRARAARTARRLIPLALIGVISAVVLGLAAAHQRHTGTPSTPPPSGRVLHTSALSLRYPGTWATTAPPDLSGLSLHDAIALTSSTAPAGRLVIGIASPQSGNPLPTRFIATHLTGTPTPELVSLGSQHFYRVLDPRLALGADAQSVYALSTPAGPVIAVCQTASQAFTAGCERVLATLQVSAPALRSASAPSRAYASALSTILARLDRARADAAHALAVARTAGEQAKAAGLLAGLHAQAAGEVAALPAGGAASANAALARALRTLADAYGTLGRGALHDDAHGYRTGQTDVRRASAQLASALAQLQRLGYAVR